MAADDPRVAGATSGPAYESDTDAQRSTGGVRREEGLGDLLSEFTTEVSSLFRQEVELAKAEVRIEAQRAGRAGAKLGAAAFAGMLAAFLLSWAIAWLLALVTPDWVAFAVVGVVYAVIAAVLAMNGKKQLQQVDPAPRQTVETLKEDKEWVQNR